jgi:hypothetical protein
MCSCGSTSCSGCGPFTVPEGATGATGATGPAGADGSNGTNGTNGTNAFKFIKIFTTTEIEQALTVSYAERTLCVPVPDGCILDTKDLIPKLDMHVAVWWRLDSGTATWKLLKCAGQGGADTGDDYNMTVNHSTGLITINTLNNLGLYRVVILA